MHMHAHTEMKGFSDSVSPILSHKAYGISGSWIPDMFSYFLATPA